MMGLPGHEKGSGEDPLKISTQLAELRKELTAWLVRKRLSAACDAEDIAQWACAQAYRVRDRYNPARAKVKTWLFQIAKNYARSRRRSERRAGRFLSLDAPGVARLAPGQSGPAEAYERQVAKDRLWRNLRRLPKQERFVLVLHFMSRRSFREIAERLHITRRQARYLAAKGLARLRRIYKVKSV